MKKEGKVGAKTLHAWKKVRTLMPVIIFKNIIHKAYEAADKETFKNGMR